PALFIGCDCLLPFHSLVPSCLCFGSGTAGCQPCAPCLRFPAETWFSRVPRFLLMLFSCPPVLKSGAAFRSLVYIGIFQIPQAWCAGAGVFRLQSERAGAKKIAPCRVASRIASAEPAFIPLTPGRNLLLLRINLLQVGSNPLLPAFIPLTPGRNLLLLRINLLQVGNNPLLPAFIPLTPGRNLLLLRINLLQVGNNPLLPAFIPLTLSRSLFSASHQPSASRQQMSVAACRRKIFRPCGVPGPRQAARIP
ncbi:hypothetical protein, partial [Candidatus Electronema sp. TJ]|uniref:hypothetical protein n=1 Tax=Candidatus Electronema sp. TJ TaxID=3401573 RepID=UPI003AA81198